MNYLQNTQESINNFAEGNTELAKEFSVKLGQQLHSVFNSEWENKQELEDLIFGEKDVLEEICNEESADFDWNDARDLQHDVMNAVIEFYGLN